MLPVRSGPPPSRRDKKQVVVHVDSGLLAVCDRLRRERDLTLQELLAAAANEAAAAFGRPTVLPLRRERVFIRRKAPAAPRAVEGARSGTVRLAGWYDPRDVASLRLLCSETGVSVEEMVTHGLRTMSIGAAA